MLALLLVKTDYKYFDITEYLIVTIMPNGISYLIYSCLLSYF